MDELKAVVYEEVEWEYQDVTLLKSKLAFSPIKIPNPMQQTNFNILKNNSCPSIKTLSVDILMEKGNGYF